MRAVMYSLGSERFTANDGSVWLKILSSRSVDIGNSDAFCEALCFDPTHPVQAPLYASDGSTLLTSGSKANHFIARTKKIEELILELLFSNDCTLLAYTEDAL